MTAAPEWAFVQYALESGETLFHQRLRVGSLVASLGTQRPREYVATPDNDMYEECVEIPDESVAAVRVSPDWWPPPAGLLMQRVYRFGFAPTVSQRAAFERRRASSLARQAHRAEPALGPEPPGGAFVDFATGWYLLHAARPAGALCASAAPQAGIGERRDASGTAQPASSTSGAGLSQGRAGGPDQPAGAGRSGLGPDAGFGSLLAAADPGLGGVALSPVFPGVFCARGEHGVRFGDPVAAPAGQRYSVDGKTIADLGAGQCIFALRISAAEYQTLLDSAVGDGAHVLPLRRTAGGVRQRTWTSVEEDGREEPFEDWPIRGPRWTAWCLDCLKREGRTLELHH